MNWNSKYLKFVVHRLLWLTKTEFFYLDRTSRYLNSRYRVTSSLSKCKRKPIYGTKLPQYLWSFLAIMNTKFLRDFSKASSSKHRSSRFHRRIIIQRVRGSYRVHGALRRQNMRLSATTVNRRVGLDSVRAQSPRSRREFGGNFAGSKLQLSLMARLGPCDAFCGHVCTFARAHWFTPPKLHVRSRGKAGTNDSERLDFAARIYVAAALGIPSVDSPASVPLTIRENRVGWGRGEGEGGWVFAF